MRIMIKPAYVVWVRNKNKSTVYVYRKVYIQTTQT